MRHIASRHDIAIQLSYVIIVCLSEYKGTKTNLWQAQEKRQHLGIVRSTKTCDWIPAGGGLEARSTTSLITSLGDVV